MKTVQKIPLTPAVLEPGTPQFNKLANIIVYIINLESRRLYLTRLLKLLYIIDEKAVSNIGIPVTHLEFKVAEKGPLADLLWWLIQCNPDMFSDYFSVTYRSLSNSYLLIPLKDANLNVLSDFEDDLIKGVIKHYKGIKTEDIIDELHKEGTLWDKTVKKHNIKFDKPESSSISKYSINFAELIKDDDLKLEAFHSLRLRNV